MRVRGTQEVVKPLEQNAFKVYIRSNIVRIDEPDTEEMDGFHGWEYDEIEMTIPEYQALVKDDVQKLKDEDLNNKMALTEIFEMLIV